MSFGLCEDTCAGTDIITRGEAADLLYALLTGEFTVAPPPILETIPLNNKEGVHLNSYLLELQKIPEPIRQAFAERGWQYTIDYAYLARLSEERNMSCIGATNYGSRQITVSSAEATVHEFGHFLDELMGFPSQTEGFYQEESGTAAALLRPYALTNEREYFADCFVYWLTYRDNSKKNGGALQRRTKNIRISFDIGKSKLAAGCIGLPAWLGLFETPQHCYYTITVSCIVNQINGNPSKIRWMHSLYYGYFVQFADCKPIENLLFYKHRKKGESDVPVTLKSVEIGGNQ